MALAPDAVALPPPFIRTEQWFVVLKDIVDRLNAMNLQGYGSPEGVVTASRAARYARLDGGSGTCFYVHEGATGTATGWVPMPATWAQTSVDWTQPGWMQ